ncbi:hypothetical protein HQ545_01100 [Candidatus Woesearchaeota archaeon]|nr:hypothetical protein [Candidatus Woesearchaeota archaeon]
MYDIMKDRKAQIAGQIFIYIIAIVVVGLIIAYGYSAIKSFTQRGEEVEYISLRTGLENSVKSIASDFGSIKRPGINIPGKYKMVCFVEKGHSESTIRDTALCQSLPGLNDYYQPLVCSAWTTGRDNVFMIPDGSDAFDVGDIKIKNDGKPYAGPFICFEVANNKINLQLKGLGDKVEVSEYS